MTDVEFWKAVGEALMVVRTRQRLNVIDVERRGGPNYATVQATERGAIGLVDSLSRHAAALGVSLVDVLRSVLSASETPVSPELQHLMRSYASTTVDGRAFLVHVTRFLPAADPGRAPTARPPSVDRPSSRRSAPRPSAAARRSTRRVR